MNAPDSVDWLPALLVLALGLAVGAVLAWRTWRASRKVAKSAPARGVAASVEVRDLAVKRDVLLRQLQELEDTASKRTPEQLARERYALELEAAHVLLALDQKGPSMVEKAESIEAPQISGPAGRAQPDRAAMRGFFWGIGSAAALVLLGALVYQSAKPREAGGSVTGEVARSGTSMAPSADSSGSSAAAADPAEAEIQAALSRNPDNIDARLMLARLRLRRQDYMGVWNETTKVLEKSPGNPQALAFQALVRLAMGQGDKALEMLKRALATDPDLLDGYANMIIVYYQMGRAKDAEATVAKASKRFPDRATDFKQLLTELRAQPAAMAAAAQPPSGADPHAGLAMPGEGASGARPASAASGPRISGTVDIDPALKSSVAEGAVLFVFVRQAGVNAGPPRAVKRLAPSFPVTFELSDADAMMGEPFPDPLLIEARLDSDGNPLTRSPTDATARLDRVKAGTQVHLVLKRQ